ncbi:uncharacterized protein LOC133900618 [Phragmites australis]|uniref:uncharacterized protein LOC133900618 n=1 Tax=Phragmites australis TaxID=29695 RepID=UPI002D767EE7|nr:uncharacterized protein LOC133900618 [Phragmites australis]
MANCPASIICLTLLFTSLQAQGAGKEYFGGGKQQQQQARRRSSSEEYVPVRRVVYRSVALPAATATAEAYEPFELCDGCRCCAASNSSSCVDTNCCYAIDCNLPGKPFGQCAFTPRTCGCGASNCSQPS